MKDPDEATRIFRWLIDPWFEMIELVDHLIFLSLG